MLDLKHVPLSQLPGKKTRMKPRGGPLVPADEPDSLQSLTKADLARLANNLAKALLREKKKQKELRKEIDAHIKRIDAMIAFHFEQTDF